MGSGLWSAYGGGMETTRVNDDCDEKKHERKNGQESGRAPRDPTAGIGTPPTQGPRRYRLVYWLLGRERFDKAEEGWSNRLCWGQTGRFETPERTSLHWPYFGPSIERRLLQRRQSTQQRPLSAARCLVDEHPTRTAIVSFGASSVAGLVRYGEIASGL